MSQVEIVNTDTAPLKKAVGAEQQLSLIHI